MVNKTMLRRWNVPVPSVHHKWTCPSILHIPGKRSWPKSAVVGRHNSDCGGTWIPKRHISRIPKQSSRVHIWQHACWILNFSNNLQVQAIGVDVNTSIVRRHLNSPLHAQPHSSAYTIAKNRLEPNNKSLVWLGQEHPHICRQTTQSFVVEK